MKLKKVFGFIALVFVSLFSLTLGVKAEALDLNVAIVNDYEDASVNEVKNGTITLPDGITIDGENRTFEICFADFNDYNPELLPAGYEAGANIYYYALRLDGVEEGQTVNAKVTMPMLDKYNTVKFVVTNSDTEIPVTIQGGTATFEISLKEEGEGSGNYSFYGNMFFKYDETKEETPVEIKTIVTDSSSKVETTINAESSLPNGSVLSVKEVEIPSELKTSETNLKKIFDISVLDAAGTIIEVKDNKMSITMNLEEELKNFNTYEVVYIKDGKVVERMPATVKDGKISFTTTHLSEYGIIAYNENKNSNENNPQTLDNISWFITLGSISLIGLLTVGLYYLRKKMN